MGTQPMALSLTFGVIACLVALLAGYPFVRFLRRRGLGKKVRVEGPSSHIEKTGTRLLESRYDAIIEKPTASESGTNS